jgi:hypothetical protein
MGLDVGDNFGKRGGRIRHAQILAGETAEVKFVKIVSDRLTGDVIYNAPKSGGIIRLIGCLRRS